MYEAYKPNVFLINLVLILMLILILMMLFLSALWRKSELLLSHNQLIYLIPSNLYVDLYQQYIAICSNHYSASVAQKTRQNIQRPVTRAS